MRVPEPPSRGMLFAERQLRRHGWRRGQGLGKRQDGIAEAIRVKVKCDTAGVGHDVAETFTFHWWDHIFNQAAANVTVEGGQDGISVRTLSEQGAQISNKKPCKAGKAGTMLYGRFVKSATLTACGEQPTEVPRGSQSSDDEDDDEKLDLSSARRLTDAELLQACGGRTAHKGARHGLTMSAKLARLEEQERAFLATYRRKQQQQPPESSPAGERKEKRKKRKGSRDGADPEELQRQQPSEEEEEEGGEEGMVVRRKKRKRKKQQELSREEEVAGEGGKVAKRKKKQKQEEEEELGEREVEEDEDEEELGEREMEEDEDEEELGEIEVERKGKRKKKKKKKKKEEEGEEQEQAETEAPLEDTAGQDQAGHSPRKKRKRRKKEAE